MRDFIRKVLIFVLIIFAIFSYEYFLNPLVIENSFPFRTPFLSVFYDTWFYPNQDNQDLQPKFDITERKANITIDIKIDKLGNRNDSIYKRPDILLLGDSFVRLTSNDQDYTIQSLLNKKTEYETYAISLKGHNFNHYFKFLEENEFAKPKVVIYEIVERQLLNLTKYEKIQSSLFSIHLF